MEELNEIRVRARNRILICCGVVLTAGLAAAIAARHPIVLLFFLPIAFIASVLSVDKPRKEYRAAFKQAVVRQALESVFTDLVYEPGEGISYETISDTGMMCMGDRFHSEDYIAARYRDICFEQSDVRIEEERSSTDANGNTTTSYVTIFRGRWMIFDFNKDFRAKLQIVEKGFPTAKRKRFFGRKETLFKYVEMESETFNKTFRVYAQNEHDAFYVITPAFMERLQNLAARNGGDLMFCFADNLLHVAIHDNRDYFEPGGLFSTLNEERILARLRNEISGITQFVDELELDNDLFIQ